MDEGKSTRLGARSFLSPWKGEKKDTNFKKNQTQQNNTKIHNIGSGQFPRKAAVAAEMKMLASF